jgi:hypothetical protein
MYFTLLMYLFNIFNTLVQHFGYTISINLDVELLSMIDKIPTTFN